MGEVLGFAEAQKALVRFIDNPTTRCYNIDWLGSAEPSVPKAFALTSPALFMLSFGENSVMAQWIMFL